jgi:hypothetical protein
LETLLQKFRQNIITHGKTHNIDGRAIAGAIAWEYEENRKGRLSDWLQYDDFSGAMAFGQGLGWGSIHTDVVKKLRPKAANWELQCLRLQAAPAIQLVAEIMDRQAKKYFEISGGIWIRDNPAVLALFFNSSDAFLEASAKRRQLNECKPGLVVKLTISQNDMAKWVNANLNRFAQFKMEPTPPTGLYAKADVE